MTPVVQLQGVTKKFGKFTAVAGADLAIQPGEYLALLGPNGAGKTTLVEMIEGIQNPSQGQISLFGLNWREHRKLLQHRLGISLQETRFFDRLKVFEILELFAGFYGEGKGRVAEILGQVGLEAKASNFTKDLSGGQRQRLALGIALLNRPELLLLDEPTTGLDPGARRDLWKILQEIRHQGTTLILTTHYMEEAQQLCERIIFMDQGRFLADGSLDQLLASHSRGEIIEVEPESPLEAGWFEGLPGLMQVERQQGQWHLVVESLVACMPALFAKAEKEGVSLQRMTSRKQTLDDLFLAMTGRRLNA